MTRILYKGDDVNEDILDGVNILGYLLDLPNGSSNTYKQYDIKSTTCITSIPIEINRVNININYGRYDRSIKVNDR